MVKTNNNSCLNLRFQYSYLWALCLNSFSFINPFHLSITVITAIVNSRNFRELFAVFIFYLSDQTTKSQAMFLLKFLRIQLSLMLSIAFLWGPAPFSAFYVVCNKVIHWVQLDSSGHWEENIEKILGLT